MSKLTLKQKRGGAVNLYEVKLTVLIHHQSEGEAQSYLFTALGDWSVGGKVIASVEMTSIEETNKRCFTSGVVYPENFDAIQEYKE
jgi:hypothetical protein